MTPPAAAQIRALARNAVAAGLTLRQARNLFDLQVTLSHIAHHGGNQTLASATLGEGRADTLRRLRRMNLTRGTREDLE